MQAALNHQEGYVMDILDEAQLRDAVMGKDKDGAWVSKEKGVLHELLNRNRHAEVCSAGHVRHTGSGLVEQVQGQDFVHIC